MNGNSPNPNDFPVAGNGLKSVLQFHRLTHLRKGGDIQEAVEVFDALGLRRQELYIIATTYWEIGRRIVEYEQGGKARAEYGETLMEQLAQDLTARRGRGFSVQGIYKMRGFYLGWEILPTPSGELEYPAKC